MRLRGSSALLILLVLATPSAADGPDEALAKELPRIPPVEPRDAPGTFRVHAGFRLEPVAVEPIVTDPVSVCYDADGRLYVVEMRGYPYPEKVPSGNVSLLEDTDDDGRFDKRTIFVDGLSWPTSVVPYDGGVFIAVAPEILYAKDTDGDGKADIKNAAFRGFGTDNVQALLNGLLWGPDGWIYGVSGGGGGEIENLIKPGSPTVSIRGRDFRFKPDGSAFEATSGGGQFGHAFDDWGHRFTCNNSNHIRQIVLPSRYLERNPALSPPAVLTDIAVEGGAGPVFRISPPEPWRVVRTRQRLADPEMVRRLAPTEKFAFGFFTSATGVTIYRGTAFPPEFRGNAFIGDVGGNLVHRKTLTKKGAIYEAKRADEGVEFLASTDNWFRPVNFTNTPDGTLLVLDMYRETIEHPASIPEPIKKHLDLTSGHDRGRLYNLVPDGFQRRPQPRLSKAPSQELVSLLAHPDSWWRETAQRLLIERADKAVIPALQALAAERPNPLSRLHAIWTLSVLGGLTEETILPALTDAEPGVREGAIALAARFAGPGPSPNSVATTFLALAIDPDPRVRFQLALSCGDPDFNAGLRPAVLARIADQDSADPWTRLAIQSSLSGRAGQFFDALVKDRPGFAERPSAPLWYEELAVLIGARNDRDEITGLVKNHSARATNPALARAALIGLGRGLRRSGGSLGPFVQDPELERLFMRAAEVARSDSPETARVEAIELVGLGPAEVALNALPDLLDARQPTAIQIAAVHALSAIAAPRVGPAIIERWRSLGPAARREASEALLARPERISALLKAIESKAIPVADLDPARRAQLLADNRPMIRERAATLLGDTARPDRGAVIDRFRPALERNGNLDRGREVFQKVCATCHKAEGQGKDVGPDLATVMNRTPEDLLIHILDPNREIQPPYVNYTIATTDGRVLSGLIAEESGNSVTLRRAEGATDVVPRDRIEAMSSTGLSLMPENLETMLDPAGMADLLTYLQGLRGGK
jgi:putative membrane-bound dehydrogenase-like protein